jgi:phosphate starvation-inducible PhoH-like protein
MKKPIVVTVPANRLMADLVGVRDENLKQVQDSFERTKIAVRGNEISVEGADAESVALAIRELLDLIEKGFSLNPLNISKTIEQVKDGVYPSEFASVEINRPKNGKPVRPKTPGQRKYVDAISNNVITLGIGPAGTGKSYLAVAIGVSGLKNRDFNRIILTRPAVEAGERLGFLPGDLMAKVDPYLRPLYDALHDLLDTEAMQRYLEKGAIEVAPLAYMRGRTLNNSFVILDEAQNTTHEQMKMFLTRLGFGSKMVITGDITQIDVPGGASSSGLVGLEQVLQGIEGIEVVKLTIADVVRHKIVADIIAAYEKLDNCE